MKGKHQGEQAWMGSSRLRTTAWEPGRKKYINAYHSKSWIQNFAFESCWAKTVTKERRKAQRACRRCCSNLKQMRPLEMEHNQSKKGRGREVGLWQEEVPQSAGTSLLVSKFPTFDTQEKIWSVCTNFKKSLAPTSSTLCSKTHCTCNQGGGSLLQGTGSLSSHSTHAEGRGANQFLDSFFIGCYGRRPSTDG